MATAERDCDGAAGGGGDFHGRGFALETSEDKGEDGEAPEEEKEAFREGSEGFTSCWRLTGSAASVTVGDGLDGRGRAA